tara:strand:+ start:806 stop:976 length:171 start_codon:yes stop_codon:yes gene_type:complete
MKPVFKPKKVLDTTQKELMKEHKKHHTKKHLDEMKKLMLKGYCFQQAHQIAKKNIK